VKPTTSQLLLTILRTMRANILTKCALTVLAKTLLIAAEEMGEEVADSSTQQPTGSARPNNLILKGEQYQIITVKRRDCSVDFLICSGP
jgi:hypothetical protein